MFSLVLADSSVMKKKKILFISHNASRSGAPFVLLYLMQWLKQHSDYVIGIFLLEEGLLMEDFRISSDVLFTLPSLIKDSEKRSLVAKISGRIKGINKNQDTILQELVRSVQVEEYDLVYANTIATMSWAISFKRIFGVKVINAIHEMTFALESFHPPAYLQAQLPLLDLIIAGSQAVADNLVTNYKVPPGMIKVVHAFIHSFVNPAPDTDLLSTLNIDKSAFIIGGVGSVEWRKGVDTVVALGLYLKKHHPGFKYHLIWIGADFKSVFAQSVKFDIIKAGLDESITLLESTSRYLDYMNEYELFILLSREDPFPLVSLEAAYLEKPILMFKGTGGTAELIANGGGEAVKYLDTEALGEAIVRLSQNADLRKQMGTILKHEVLEKYTSDVTCKKVLHILNSLS